MNSSYGEMMTSFLSLHQLSLTDTEPADLPGIARAVDLDYVSVFVTPPSPKLDIFPRIKAGRGVREFKSACAAYAIKAHNVDVFSIGPDVKLEEFKPALEIAAEIGAHRLTALLQDPDPVRSQSAMSKLADMAGACGIKVSIEFMKFSELRSIDSAAAFVENLQHDNVTLLVDLLHLMRTGGSIANLKAIRPKLIGAAQLCDGPIVTSDSPFAEAVEDRGVPGEGEFPSIDFLAALPPNCPLDIEVPLKRFSDAGMSAADRAQMLVKSTRELLAHANRS